MAQTVSQEALRAAVERSLEPGEILQYAVFGVDLPFWKAFLAAVAAIIVAGFMTLALPDWSSGSGVLSLGMVRLVLLVLIANAIQFSLRKDYILALTSRRLLLQRVKVPLFSVHLDRQLEMREWPAQAPPPVAVDVGTVWTSIRVADPTRPVRFRVVYIAQKGGKAQAQGLAAALRPQG